MSSGYEPVLHALSAEPAVAHPGEPVCIHFRTRNAGTVSSPAATIRFILPPGLEPCDGAIAEQVLEPVAPGGVIAAELRCRIVAPIDDGAELRVQAAVHGAETVFGTNACAVTACSRPVLDGPESGVFVEPAEDGRIRVRTVLTNEGDGAARGVRVVIPPPHGTVACDSPAWSPERDAFIVDCAQIETGDTFVAAFDVRIAAPVEAIRPDDVSAWLTDGAGCTIPARSEIALRAALARPQVSLTPGRRRLDAALVLANEGWADARDTRIEIGLPPGMRLRDETVSLDDVPVRPRGANRKARGTPFARFERFTGGLLLSIDRIAARSDVRIEFGAALGTCSSGTLAVSVRSGGDELHALQMPFTVPGVRDVRMRVVAAPCRSESGDVTATIAIENTGDVPEALRLSLIANDGHVVVARELDLGAGEAVLDRLLLAAAGERVPAASAALVLSDHAGERARLMLALPRARAQPAFGALHARCARSAAPGAARVRALLRAPTSVVAGVPFDVEATIDVLDPADALVLRVPAAEGLVHVPGSTTLDDGAVLDRGEHAPLLDGLTLTAVPAGTSLRLRFALIARDHAAYTIGLIACAGGQPADVAPARVAVEPLGAFYLRPAGLAYHVDAHVAPLSPAVPSRFPSLERIAAADAVEADVLDAVPDAFDGSYEHAATVDEGCGERLQRVARGAPGNALVSHLLALHALFAPAVEQHADARGADLLHVAMADVFERLFVKLRIPGFTVACSDLEDPVLRRALLACAPEGDDVLAAAAYGAPGVMRALGRLAPSRCDRSPAAEAALQRYRVALDDALGAFEGLPQWAFEDALQRDAGPPLQRARSALVEALGASFERSGAA